MAHVVDLTQSCLLCDSAATSKGNHYCPQCRPIASKAAYVIDALDKAAEGYPEVTPEDKPTNIEIAFDVWKSLSAHAKAMVAVYIHRVITAANNGDFKNGCRLGPSAVLEIFVNLIIKGYNYTSKGA